MTIKERLLADEHQNKQAALGIAKAAASSVKEYKALMNCFFSPDYRLSQRAAWVASHTIKLNQKMILPYLKKMVAQLSEVVTPVAVTRNTLRMLREIEIPENVQGSLMNSCFILAEKADTPIAIKAFSLHILQKLSHIHPDIKDELKLLAELNMMNENAAVRNVSSKILK